MAKDLLLERCLVKVMSRNLQEKIQVLRWGTSSAGGPSHCFLFSMPECQGCVAKDLLQKATFGTSCLEVFVFSMPERQGCMAKDLLLERCLQDKVQVLR